MRMSLDSFPKPRPKAEEAPAIDPIAHVLDKMVEEVERRRGLNAETREAPVFANDNEIIAANDNEADSEFGSPELRGVVQDAIARNREAA